MLRAKRASAYLVSPFEEAAVLTADALGEWATTTTGHARESDIALEREIRFPHSLGLFYSAISAYLGFRVNDAEWKVMGLAPYGEDRFSRENVPFLTRDTELHDQVPVD